MDCKISDVKSFKDCVMVSGDLLFEFHIICDNEGVRWTGLDKGHVSFIECNLSPDFFVEYDCPTPVEIIVDAQEFLNVIKRCNNNDTIILSSDDYKLHVRYVNDHGERNFELKYIDSVENTFNMPPIPFTVTDVPVPFKSLFEYMNDCLLYTTDVKLSIVNGAFTVGTNGDLGAYNGKINLDESYDDDISSVFNVDKLMIFKKFSVFDKLYFSGGNDMPCLFTVHDDSDDVCFKLMVANKIVEE